MASILSRKCVPSHLGDRLVLFVTSDPDNHSVGDLIKIYSHDLNFLKQNLWLFPFSACIQLRVLSPQNNQEMAIIDKIQSTSINIPGDTP